MVLKFVDIEVGYKVIYRDRIELEYREWVFERTAFYTPLIHKPHHVGVIIHCWAQGIPADGIRAQRIATNPRPWIVDGRIVVLPLQESYFMDFIIREVINRG